MIRLTEEDGKSVYVPADVLIRDKVPFADSILGGKETKTHVIWGNYEIVVTESPQEVARKVLEWRLAMERYRAYVNAAALDEKPQSNECWELAANAKAELVRLARLEEPNHD